MMGTKKEKALNFLNNLVCAFMVAAVFAMIGVEYGNIQGPTHSGSQTYRR